MSLLQMSFSGTIMILVIVMIRALAINKLPKKTFLALWGMVLLRLLLPFSVPSEFSVYSLLSRFVPTQSISEGIANGIALPLMPTENITQIQANPIINETGYSVSVWTAIWFVGMFLYLLFFMVSYCRCRREFKTSLPVNNEYIKHWLSEQQMHRSIEIRQSDRILAPLTYGVFHPVILIPKTINWADEASLDYILAHECVHIRRFDAVTKLLTTATLCVHWFNPVVWVMYVLANRDIELSCDETVVRLFGESTRSAYAMAIIRMAEIKSGMTPLCNNFSKYAIEERIVAIMKCKKNSLAAIVIAFVLVVAIGVTCATSNSIATNGEDIVVSNVSGEGYPSADVEWWTYDEYKEWLENEKVVLQGMLGEKAYTGGNGEFIWTQEIIDDTIAKYEETLQDIKNGLKISKTVDGSSDIMLAQYDNGENVVEAAKELAIVFENGDTFDFGTYDTPYPSIDADWSTFTEYQEWVENQKVELQSMLGKTTSTGGNGQFIWTQEVIDDTIAQYEKDVQEFEKALEELKTYCEEQMQLGYMTKQEADKLIQQYE